MNIINEIVGAIFQVLLFTLIPFVVYLVREKKTRGFWEYIGLIKSTNVANRWAVITSLLIAGMLMLLAMTSPEMLEIMHDSKSVTGKFKASGISGSSIVVLFVIAVFKTSLAEEILFRGFIAKRLIAIFGYKKGNLFQALLFGVVHTAIFAMVVQHILLLSIIFVVPTIGAYVSVFLNEKLANGSIIPGWISHALGNLVSYCVIGYVL